MWTPTHILVTVCKARNLLDKGKGGNDAYCMIGMGKEKFLTSVRHKSLSPTWDEQAEFELVERADLKITVYHKSSIIDEFIGRVVISVGDLFNENNKSFVKWYKLQSKEENSKKAAKERGELEVRVEFITKPKTGSVMDLHALSKTNKEKTLSLKNLKDKSSSFKHSFKENFKILGKSKSKSKINEDNQLGEQSRRMNGSKLDFLDGEDMNSLTSSYSSINGNRLSNENKQINSMSRYNPSRSSFISGSSSRNDLDSLNDNSTNNEEEMNDENIDESQMSFNRNNSFRRSSVRRPSKKSNKKNSPENENIDQSKVHNAPLLPFGELQQQQQQQQQQQRHHVLNSIIHEESVPSSQQSTNQNFSPSNPFVNDIKQEEPSFANIFTSSFASGLEKPELDSVKIEPLIIQQDPKPEEQLVVPEIKINQKSPKKDETFNSSVITLTKSELSSNEKKNVKKYDDDDQIDWASSDDEEIVKQEVDAFERNQTFNKKQNNFEQTQAEESSNFANKNIKTNQALDNNFPATSTFSIDLDPFSSTASSVSSSFTNLNKVDSVFDNQIDQNQIKFFDPFSDFNFKMSDQNQEQVEEVIEETMVSFDNNFEPSVDIETYENTENTELPIMATQEEQELNIRDPDQDTKSDSSESYSIQVNKLQRKTILEEEENTRKDDTDNEKDLDDDMDNAFQNFASKLDFKSDTNDDMSNLANDLAEATRTLDEVIEENLNEQNADTFNEDQQDESSLSEPSANFVKSELIAGETDTETFSRNRILRQSERRRVIPTQDLTSDLNSERDFSTNNDSFVSYGNVTKSNRSSMKFDFNEKKNSKFQEEEIKTPDFDHNFIFQDEQSFRVEQESSMSTRGLPDLINQKEPKKDKAKKYLEGLDGVKLNEITVPDSLKKQLEYFDRDELLQLIAYQKKHLDLKESRIKDLENYIDNLVVKIIETEPGILMNVSCANMKTKQYI